MKQIGNKEYEEWQKYKSDKANGWINSDYIRFICEACNFNPEKIGELVLGAYAEHKRRGD